MQQQIQQVYAKCSRDHDALDPARSKLSSSSLIRQSFEMPFSDESWWLSKLFNTCASSQFHTLSHKFNLNQSPLQFKTSNLPIVKNPKNCDKTTDKKEVTSHMHLINSFSSAATTIGEKGNNNVAFVPVSNLVSQLAI